MKTQDPPADGFALPESGISEAVRAAQERLYEIRRSSGIETRGRMELRITNYELGIRNEEDSPPAPLSPCPPAQITNYELRITNKEPAPNSYLVSRISYFSEPLARHLRDAAERRERRQASESREWLKGITNYELRITNGEGRGGERERGGKGEGENTPAPLPPRSPARPTTDDQQSPNSYLVSRISNLVKVYPDIALAMLRTKTAAPGRVWLLLRHADGDGRGRIALDDAARLLTGDGAPLRICGRKQLGNLLRAGDGRYWERDTDRSGREWLRLHSAARVAAGLGVRRLAGSPVAVPIDALTGTIGQARAHLYAAFHSGRTQIDLLTGERRGRGPIARSTLCKLSGAAANSQRNYERRARVGRRAAIAVGPLATAADEQETAWERGRALFRLPDRDGRYGRPGAVYLAWQLPNEYTGPHATLPRGRQKRLNRSLADLFHNGMTGNGGGGITNYELRITNQEAAGGQYSVSSEQYPVNSIQWSVVGGQYAISSGQWPEKEEVNARTQGRKDDTPPCASAPLRPCVDFLRSSPGVRQYYASAKAAHLARHAGERYWRHGGVWLWQPELRDTKYEIREKADEWSPVRRRPIADYPMLTWENKF